MQKQKQKLKMEIEVWDIDVEQTQKYENGNGSGNWTFSFRYRKNGGNWKHGKKDGSWSSQTKAHFKRAMNKGYAAECVMQDLF